MAVIDYTNECDNEDHNPGCICGVPFFNAKASVKTVKQDPYHQDEPNKLYFRQYDPTFSGDTLVHYWMLTNPLGIRIAAAENIYSSKLEAMRNCITIFGRELRAGDHRVVDDDDNKLMLEELHRVDVNLNVTAKKAV